MTRPCQHKKVNTYTHTTEYLSLCFIIHHVSFTPELMVKVSPCKITRLHLMSDAKCKEHTLRMRVAALKYTPSWAETRATLYLSILSPHRRH